MRPKMPRVEMEAMRKTLLAGLLIALPACSASSSDTASTASTAAAEAAAKPTVLDGQVSMLGRYRVNDDGSATFGWPGSGFAVTTDKPVRFELEDPGNSRIDVFVGEERSIITTQAGRHVYEITPDARATVSVRRASEGYTGGLTTLVSIETGDGAVAAKPADRRILFVGDSITAGYGVLGADRSCNASAENSSAQDAYGALTADNFDSDYHVVAVSGRGAAVNWAADPRPNMLSQLNFSLPDTPSDWNSDHWTPNVIVVALGTNDWSQIDPDPAFTANMTGIFMGLAGQHPEAQIFALTGPMLAEDKAAKANAAIAQAAQNVLSYGTVVHVVDVQLSGDGPGKWGCQWHPGKVSSRLMADTLSLAISEQTGWEFLPPEN